MNRMGNNSLSIAIACIGLTGTLSLAAAAADDPIVTADRAVVAALAKGDKAAANKWLDQDFNWIDSEGIMWFKDDAFRAGLKPLVTAGDDVKVIEHKYGASVVWIQWNQGNKYSARFWVKRPSGWKLLHTTEIAAVPKRDFQTIAPAYDIPCNNPCKAVPYKPLGAGEKAALDEWQEQESSQANWEKHVADDMDQPQADYFTAIARKMPRGSNIDFNWRKTGKREPYCLATHGVRARPVPRCVLIVPPKKGETPST